MAVGNTTKANKKRNRENDGPEIFIVDCDFLERKKKYHSIRVTNPGVNEKRRKRQEQIRNATEEKGRSL